MPGGESGAPGEKEPRPWSEGWQLRLAAGILLSFIGGITLGDVPYTLAGYGLSAFALLTLAFLFPPTEALVAFAIGDALGLAVDAYSQSIFLFVAVGAAIIRPLQLIAVTRTKRFIGIIGSGLLGIAVGAFAAIAVGMATFGGNGSMTAFAEMDALYLFPAYLVLRWSKAPVSAPSRWAGIIVTVVATLVAFLSASTYFVPVSFFISLLLLGASYIVVNRPRLSLFSFRRSTAAGIVTVATVLAVGSMMITPTAASHAIRSDLYALYPDSLGGHQWIQTDASPACEQGNIAGGGEIQNGVWHPERLRVLSTCVTVTGTLMDITPSIGTGTDGDYSFDILADPGFSGMLSMGNDLLESGYLHAEVVPMDQHRVLGNLSLHPGQRLQVTGAFVLDTDHGWGAEVHPAWSVQVLPNTTTTASGHTLPTGHSRTPPIGDGASLLPGAGLVSRVGSLSSGPRTRPSPW